ncbi:hypothetical protein GT037_006345 [Alternaria burnsii]|uniref:DUF6604 domain-containing protein n=1 Tax=Alternaria burnsii TaxID=1187904 RepID=A0A8H7B1M7_9PLEO|nr:uncharacterized protein GT037_006345 [Alternaria burnsii]KAF7675626.1 hypothetical protein GT037_006345 [Alternaria burnsii]CAI9632594.1 unnamed protein product [Alternaria burnsii]
MSDQTRLKHGTKHIQKYPVKASIKSTGHLSWIKKCRTNPGTRNNHMKISVFLRCGETIAKDLSQVALIPNSVLRHLRDAMLFRDSEIALRAPLAESDPKIKKNRNRHFAFNAALQDVLRMLTVALRRLSQRRNESTVSPVSNKYDLNSFRHPYVEEPDDAVLEGQNNSEIFSELDPAVHDLDMKEEEIDQQDIETFLGHNVLLLGIQQDALDIWEKCHANELSPAASAVITGFAYQSIRAEVSKTEVAEQVPLVRFPGCSDAGIIGLLYPLYENFRGQALRKGGNTVRQASARDIARTLFMLTLKSYLTVCTLKDNAVRTYMSTTTDMPPLPTSDPSTKLRTVEQIEASNNVQRYEWQASGGLCSVNFSKTMSIVERIEGRQCYSVTDALTHSLPRTLQTDKPEFWEVVSLDSLLRVVLKLNEDNDFFRQGQALLDVADHVEALRKQWFAGKLYIPPQLGVAMDIIDTVVRKDYLTEIGKKYNHKPPPQLILHYNHTLNGLISQAILRELGDAVGVAEVGEPAATSVAIFYKAITTVGYLKNSWAEMDFLIAFFGLESILSQNTLPTSFHDFYKQARLMLLSGRAIEFLQPTSFQKCLQRWVSNCLTDNFKEMVSFLVVHLRKERSAWSVVATTPETKSKFEMTSESMNKFTPATNLEEAGARSTEDFRVPLQPNAPQTDSQSERDPPPITSTPNQPTHASEVQEEQGQQAEEDQQTSESLGHDEFGPCEILQAFAQLMQAQDVVAHLAKGTLWLERTQLASYIKDVYASLTEDQPYVGSTEDFKYIPLLLEFLYRNDEKREDVLRNGVLETFSQHIKKNGGKHLQKVKDISGVNWKGNS